MNLKWPPILLSIVMILLYGLQPSAAMAAQSPSFKLAFSTSAPTVGQSVTVTVTGSNLSDVYGYEVNFVYDKKVLMFKSAKSTAKGFSVSPTPKEDRIVFAHTKTGEVAGDSGSIELCTLTFEVLAEGDASVKLTDVKLVDSKLKAVKLTAGVQAKAKTGKSDGTELLFSDIKGHWAKENIERAVGLGFVTGYEDGKFRPQGQVTRAEFAAMLARALKLDGEGGGTAGFTDSGHIPQWAASFISQAASAGILEGYEDGSFRAGNSITRAEITVMLTRSLKLNPDSGLKSSFADAAQIPAWAHPSVAAASEAGLIQGRGGNLFAPMEHATRAEVVTLILALLDYRAETAG